MLGLRPDENGGDDAAREESHLDRRPPRGHGARYAESRLDRARTAARRDPARARQADERGKIIVLISIASMLDGIVATLQPNTAIIAIHNRKPLSQHARAGIQKKTLNPKKEGLGGDWWAR